MAYTWIKLYLSLLDDTKVGRLPAQMFKSFIQLLLVAREYDHDGLLEPVPGVAWRLRTSEEELLATLQALSEIGLMKETPDGWLVVNFTKEQAPFDGAERMRQSRERKNSLKGDVTERHNKYDEENEQPCDAAAEDPSSSASASGSDSESVFRSVSESVSESEPAREFSAESDPETVPDRGRGDRTAAGDPASAGGDDPAGVVGHRLAGSVSKSVAGKQIQAIAAYEQNIGRVTPLIAESLREMEREYSPPWVIAAIREAVRANGLSLSYVDAILQRWKRDGFRSGKKSPRKRHEHRGAEVQRMVDEFMGR